MPGTKTIETDYAVKILGHDDQDTDHDDPTTYDLTEAADMDSQDPRIDFHQSDTSTGDDRFSLSDSEDQDSISARDDTSQEEDEEGSMIQPLSSVYVHDLTERREKNKIRNAERLRVLGLSHSTTYSSDVLLSTKVNNNNKRKKRALIGKNDSNLIPRKRPRGMLLSNGIISNQRLITTKHHFKPKGSKLSILQQSIIEIMEEKYMYRSSQIRLLASIFQSCIRLAQCKGIRSDPYSTEPEYIPAPLLITGPKATGKTSVVRDTLEYLKMKTVQDDSSVRMGIAYVNLEIMESRTIPSLMDDIYHQLASSLAIHTENVHRQRLGIHGNAKIGKHSSDPLLDKYLDDNDDDDEHDQQILSMSEDEHDNIQDDEDLIEKARGMGLSRKRRSNTSKNPVGLTSRQSNVPSIQNAMSLGRALLQLMNPLTIAGLPSLVTNSCGFVVIDNVEHIFSLAHRRQRNFGNKGKNERNNVLTQLLLLPQVIGLNLTFILVSRHLFISHARINNYQSPMMALGTVGDTLCPVHIYFQAYRGTELRNILFLPRMQEWITGTHPSCYRSDIQSTLYKSMVERMIQMMENITRDMSELIRLCRLLWPVYLSKLSNSSIVCSAENAEGEGHSMSTASSNSSLMEYIQKHTRQLMSLCLPIPGHGYDSDILGEQACTRMRSSTDDKTAYLTKFLLLAAFICQRNKSDHDEVLFTDKNQGKKSRRSKDVLDDNIAFATSEQLQLHLKSVRVPSFPLERMLSVFSSIVSKYGRALTSSIAAGHDDLSHVVANIGTFSFFQAISQLRQWFRAARYVHRNIKTVIHSDCNYMMKSSSSESNVSLVSRHMSGEAEITQYSRSRLPCRVEFCSSNALYGAINCLPHGNAQNIPKNSEINLLQPTNRKLGPILLEIRQLVLNYEKGPEKQSTNIGYVGRLVAISRGIVSSSVTSTCLSFRKDPRSVKNGDDIMELDDLQCATGLSSGLLSVHTFKNLNSYTQNNATVLDSAFSDDSVVNYYQYHQRTNRPVSVVSWRHGAGADYSRHVALGLTGLSSVDKGSTTTQPGVALNNVDREYCAIVWDIEAQSGSKGSKQSPLFRLAHNIGVSSLSWLGGQLLGVGTQHKNVQMYDLRASGTNSPPISFAAHRDDVSGIEADPSRPSIFATFSKTYGESVKLWDLRKTDTCLSEIKHHATFSGSSKVFSSSVSAISWNSNQYSSLCVATGDLLRYYDTRSNASKPLLVKVTHLKEPIQSLAYRSKESSPTMHMNFERMIVVNMAGEVMDLPMEQSSPLALSHRDGRLVHAFGLNTWMYPSVKEDPSSSIVNDDVSVAIHRRAKNLKSLKDFADSRDVGTILSEENESWCNAENNRRISNVWTFIDTVEKFVTSDSGSHDDASIWHSRSLVDSGILRLLTMQDKSTAHAESISAIGFKLYDSPARRAALDVCGWSNSFDDDNFERSAALAVWHGNIEQAVDIINRSSAFIRHVVESGVHDECDRPLPLMTTKYAEALDLLSFCIAGYNSNAIWSQACSRLLQRSEFNIRNDRTYTPYIRALCTFLLHANDSNVSNLILSDENLSLVDRIAFACSFLDMNNMIKFLNVCLDRCLEEGNLEGLILSGLDKIGFALLQSYVDKTSDVQTAAVMSSLLLIPYDWVLERSLCSLWVENYRDLLNRWQLWQFRAAFDVVRADKVRKLKKHADDVAGNLVSLSGSRPSLHSSRRTGMNSNNINPTRKLGTIDSKQGNVDTTIPPQVHARCNYCNTSLPLMTLRRNETFANLFMSRQKPNASDQKPILSCCPNPQCRKPLPRCAVCLLPLGCLNPFLEMKKRGRTGLTGGDDLSGLANLPFAEWFTWCMKCKHGGHAHHIVGWFANHGETCPVSGCNCNCQSDTLQKQCRGISKK